MENSRFLKHWRGWSGLRKAQIVFTTIGLFVTIVMGVFNLIILAASGSDSSSAWNMLQIGILMAIPTDTLVKFLGFETARLSWLLLSFLELVVNGVIGLAFGTLVGLPWLVSSKGRDLNHKN